MLAPDDGGDSLGCGLGGVHGGQVGNLLVDGGLAQVGIVVLALLARRSVDNQVDFPVDHGQIGDKVKVMETRPLSKDKRWRVVEIVEKADIK